MNLWSLLRVKPVHDGKFIGALRDPQIYTALWGPGLAHGEVSSRRLRVHKRKVLRDLKQHDMHENFHLFHNPSNSRTKALGRSEGFQGLISSLVPGQGWASHCNGINGPTYLKPSTYAECRLPTCFPFAKVRKGKLLRVQ